MKVSPDDINSFPESEAIDLASAVVQLLDTVEQLKVAIEERDNQISVLQKKLDESVLGLQHELNGVYVSLDRIKDRLDKMENIDPRPKQIQRAELLRDIIKANGGAVTYKQAKRKLEISTSSLSQLTKTMPDVVVRKGNLDARDRTIEFTKEDDMVFQRRKKNP